MEVVRTIMQCSTLLSGLHNIRLFSDTCVDSPLCPEKQRSAYTVANNKMNDSIFVIIDNIIKQFKYAQVVHVAIPETKLRGYTWGVANHTWITQICEAMHITARTYPPVVNLHKVHVWLYKNYEDMHMRNYVPCRFQHKNQKCPEGWIYVDTFPK
jgi:hypothetical protein